MFSPKILTILLALLFFLPVFSAKAITLSSGDEDFTTISDITEEDDGIASSLSGTFGDYNNITNNHIITTGDDGAKSSAYGITLSGDYNVVNNSVGSQINTTGSSGRGIDADDNVKIYNSGLIQTLGRSGYAVYVGGDNSEVENSGSIITKDSSSHGIYFNGNDNIAENSGSINTAYGYGVYLNGNRNNFTNSSIIQTTDGSSAYGIYISAGSDLASTASEFTNVINDGEINSNSHGIYNKDAYSNIINNGDIVSNASDSGKYGISNEGENAKIYNHGSITSNRYAFYNSNAGDGANFYNYGDLNGDVRLGESTLNFLGGSLSGSITGNDNQGNIIVGSSLDTNITFDQRDVFEELNSVTITGQSVFNSYHELEAISVQIDDESSFVVNEGAQIDSDIYGYSEGVGNFDILANYSTTNLVGKSGNSLGNVNISNGATFTYGNSIYANAVNVAGVLDISSLDMVINGNLNGLDGGRIEVGNRNHIVINDLNLASASVIGFSLKDGEVGKIRVLGNVSLADSVGMALDTSQNEQFIADDSNFILFETNNVEEENIIKDENINVDGSGSNISGILRYSTKYINSNLNLNVSRISAAELSNNKNTQNIYNYVTDLGDESKGSLLKFQSVLNGTEISEAEGVLSEIMAFPHKANLEVALKNINYLSEISSERLMEFDAKKDKTESLWLSPLGYNINQEKINDDEAYGVNGVGLILGFDKALTDDFMIGVAVNYMKADIKTKDDLKKNLFSTIGFEVYSRSKFSDYFWDNFAGFGINALSQSRSVKSVELDATSRYFGQSYLLKSKVGRVYKIYDYLNLTPSFSLNYNLVKLPGYEEDGAGELNLEVDDVSASYVKNEIGLELSVNAKLPKEFQESDFKFSDLLGFVKITYGHFLKADNPEVKANFIGQDESFTTKISNIDRSELGLGAGFKFFSEDDIALGLEANLVKRDSYASHCILVKMNKRF